MSVSNLNMGLSSFWDVLLRTARLNIDDLEVATNTDIVEATPEPDSGLIELIWRERLPLGMNLLLNDEGGRLKVVDFPRGSQARTVCEYRNLNPDDFKGATVVAVNGIRYHSEDDLFEALKDPGRPKTIQFELAESEDAERIRKFVENSQDNRMLSKKIPSPSSTFKRDISTRDVDFVDAMDLGIEFANAIDDMGLVVRRFLESKDELVLAAERKRDQIKLGDLMTHINGKLVVGENGSGRIKALKLLESDGKQRPLQLTFASPYLHSIAYEQSESLPYCLGGPEEVMLKEDKETKQVLLNGFKDVDSASEKAGVLIGDYLVFINGAPVGAGCRWMGERSVPSLAQIENMLKDKSKYPIGLTFARPNRQGEQGGRDWTSTLLGVAPQESISMERSETICVSADFYEQLGLDLELKANSDVIVKDLRAVEGPFQLSTKSLCQNNTYDHLAIESINSEFVPSYATPNIVKSAMERSWRSEKRVDITYCDTDTKNFVLSLNDK